MPVAHRVILRGNWQSTDIIKKPFVWGPLGAEFADYLTVFFFGCGLLFVISCNLKLWSWKLPTHCYHHPILSHPSNPPESARSYATVHCGHSSSVGGVAFVWWYSRQLPTPASWSVTAIISRNVSLNSRHHKHLKLLTRNLTRNHYST